MAKGGGGKGGGGDGGEADDVISSLKVSAANGVKVCP